MKSLFVILLLVISHAALHAQNTARLQAIDTTYSELVYVDETIDGQTVTGLGGSRHKFSVVEGLEQKNDLQTIKLSFNACEYTLSFQDKKAISLHLEGNLVATISDTVTIINKKAYTFKKTKELEFSYSHQGQEIMHGKILHGKINRKNIYGQYLDFKKFQHENQEMLVVLASFYTTRVINKMVKRNKSFFYNLLE
jgi:hypothetical protein